MWRWCCGVHRVTFARTATTRWFARHECWALSPAATFPIRSSTGCEMVDGAAKLAAVDHEAVGLAKANQAIAAA
jgi:hypothetical protein